MLAIDQFSNNALDKHKKKQWLRKLQNELRQLFCSNNALEKLLQINKHYKLRVRKNVRKTSLKNFFLLIRI